MAKWSLILLGLCLLLASCMGNQASYQQGYEEGAIAGKLEAEANIKTRLEESQAIGYDLGYRCGLGEAHCDFCLNQPSHKQVLAFLDIDDTDELQGVNCIVFTQRLLQNAHEAGWLCYPVILNFTEGGSHVLVAFDTVDKGDVFIEPQTDEEVEVEVGKEYGQYLCEGNICYIEKYFIKQVGIFK